MHKQNSLNKIRAFIIPSNIKNDNRLSYGARLLYGDIYEQSRENGYTTVTNKEFAQIYNVAPKTIGVWISQLKKYGYIDTQFEYTTIITEDWCSEFYTKNKKFPLVKIPISYY
ncbi:MAG: helix-turn-helix domain-containing protein [Candidatus Gastranaerophilales bacterium]|nr:helix-turn-helix domain-containing protein [Candidatus Gastranaerophilales bacterium]